MSMLSVFIVVVTVARLPCDDGRLMRMSTTKKALLPYVLCICKMKWPAPRRALCRAICKQLCVIIINLINELYKHNVYRVEAPVIVIERKRKVWPYMSVCM